jgi:hypothetical protein
MEDRSCFLIHRFPKGGCADPGTAITYRYQQFFPGLGHNTASIKPGLGYLQAYPLPIYRPEILLYPFRQARPVQQGSKPGPVKVVRQPRGSFGRRFGMGS